MLHCNKYLFSPIIRHLSANYFSVSVHFPQFPAFADANYLSGAHKSVYSGRIARAYITITPHVSLTCLYRSRDPALIYTTMGSYSRIGIQNLREYLRLNSC